jgi:hypothetical protein
VNLQTQVTLLLIPSVENLLSGWRSTNGDEGSGGAGSIDLDDDELSELKDNDDLVKYHST